MSEETKTVRKPTTPNIDRVVEAIDRGDYDDKVLRLWESLTNRREVLKAQILEQVRQVFGQDAKVVASEKFSLPSTEQTDRGEDTDNPFVKKSERTETAAERGRRVMQNANVGKTRPAPKPTNEAAEELDENQVTPDPLENINPIEERLMRGEAVTEIEHRGAIISGLGSSQIGD